MGKQCKSFDKTCVLKYATQATLDKSSKVNCEYCLPTDFKEQINKTNQNNNFSMSIRSRDISQNFKLTGGPPK
jgi:hypothetical protein